MKTKTPEVLGVRRMSSERRFAYQLVTALAVALAGYHMLVKPEARLLKMAQATLAAQAKDLSDVGQLPQVADDLPVAIKQMGDRHHELLAKLNASADASKMYDMIGQLAGKSGVRTDRIDPVRNGDSRAASSGGKDKNRLVLESYGYSIEAVGSFDKLAGFIDQLNTSTGVTRISNLVIEPLETPEGQEQRIRAIITTVHYRMPQPRKDAPPTKAEQGGRS
jgi:hypothetical protein